MLSHVEARIGRRLPADPVPAKVVEKSAQEAAPGRGAASGAAGCDPSFAVMAVAVGSAAEGKAALSTGGRLILGRASKGPSSSCGSRSSSVGRWFERYCPVRSAGADRPGPLLAPGGFGRFWPPPGWRRVAAWRVWLVQLEGVARGRDRGPLAGLGSGRRSAWIRSVEIKRRASGRRQRGQALTRLARLRPHAFLGRLVRLCGLVTCLKGQILE